MTLDDWRNLSAIGGFVLAIFVGLAGWYGWRAVVAVKLDTMEKKIDGLVEADKELAKAHADFEKEVRTSYVTANALKDIRDEMARGFLAVTSRIDAIFSHKT